MAKGKAGRNKVKCQAYRANGTREKNKARKAARILRGFSSKPGTIKVTGLIASGQHRLAAVAREGRA